MTVPAARAWAPSAAALAEAIESQPVSSACIVHAVAAWFQQQASPVCALEVHCRLLCWQWSSAWSAVAWASCMGSPTFDTGLLLCFMFSLLDLHSHVARLHSKNQHLLRVLGHAMTASPTQLSKRFALVMIKGLCLHSRWSVFPL